MRGENFPMRWDPDEAFTLCGFYTTRWVKADTPEAAEAAALVLLRSEEVFAFPVGYTGPVNAKVFFEEIEEVQAPERQGGGATWFRMEDSDQT